MAQSTTTRAWARGGVVLAATLMLIVGLYQLFLGIAAIAKGSFFVVGPNYAYTVNVSTWGWIHLAIGIVAVLTGFALFTGQMWARILGVGLLVVSAVANFFFLPYYPLWSLLIIAVDVFAIWAIAHSGREMAGIRGGATGAYAGGDQDYGAAQTGERWPATNTAQGRHWAGEPAKEGVSRTQAENERAEAMAQRGMGGQGPQSGTGTGSSGGSGMPTNPQTPQ